MEPPTNPGRFSYSWDDFKDDVSAGWDYQINSYKSQFNNSWNCLGNTVALGIGIGLAVGGVVAAPPSGGSSLLLAAEGGAIAWAAWGTYGSCS